MTLVVLPQLIRFNTIALTVVGAAIGATTGTLVGTLVGILVGTLVRIVFGTLVGTLVGTRVGTLVGTFVVVGVVTGMVGADGPPIYKISIPLMDGFSIPTVKSIVIEPSVTNTFVVTTSGTSLPGALRKISILSSTNDPSTNTSNTRLFTVL